MSDAASSKDDGPLSDAVLAACQANALILRHNRFVHQDELGQLDTSGASVADYLGVSAEDRAVKQIADETITTILRMSNWDAFELGELADLNTSAVDSDTIEEFYRVSEDLSDINTSGREQ